MNRATTRRGALRGAAAAILALGATPAAQAAPPAPSPRLAVLVAEFERVHEGMRAIENDPALRGLDMEDRPGFLESEGRLEEITAELHELPAGSMPDVLLFCRMLQHPWIHDWHETAADLGFNLADDLLRLFGGGVA